MSNAQTGPEQPTALIGMRHADSAVFPHPTLTLIARVGHPDVQVHQGVGPFQASLEADKRSFAVQYAGVDAAEDFGVQPPLGAHGQASKDLFGSTGMTPTLAA